jgi:PAS domain S-box-containing protein
MRAHLSLSLPAWARYTVAALVSAAALAATGAGWDVLQYVPSMTSFLGVFLIGWFCGGGPSFLTLALCTAGLNYFFLPPAGSLLLQNRADGIRLAGFVVVGLIGSAAFAKLRVSRQEQARLVEDADRAREAAEKTTREIERILEDRRRDDQRLRRFAAIVESSEDAIIVEGLDGTIIGWNAAAERLFGFRAEEIVGHSISILMPPGHTMDEILDRIRLGEGIEHFETARMKKSGETVPVSLSVSPVRDASGTIVAAAKIARDITDQKMFEADRERLYREAQEAARVREDFLSVAGHELRTPLTSLQFQLYSLRRRLAAGQTEKAADLVERLSKEIERLARLTEELLDVTQVTSGHLSLELREADLAEIARETAERLRAAAARVGSEIRVEAREPTLGVWDHSRLDQVVTNLLENAVKFGEGRPIEISVESDREFARLIVRDHGIGISPADQLKIFERFERAVSRRSYGGMGLGLWISRQIVEAHGGRIAVSSEPGGGSTFRMDLPRRAEKGAVA